MIIAKEENLPQIFAPPKNEKSRENKNRGRKGFRRD